MWKERSIIVAIRINHCRLARSHNLICWYNCRSTCHICRWYLLLRTNKCWRYMMYWGLIGNGYSRKCCGRRNACYVMGCHWWWWLTVSVAMDLLIVCMGHLVWHRRCQWLYNRTRCCQRTQKHFLKIPAGKTINWYQFFLCLEAVIHLSKSFYNIRILIWSFM